MEPVFFTEKVVLRVLHIIRRSLMGEGHGIR